MNYESSFNREDLTQNILNFLNTFEREKQHSTIKRGLFFYGKHGIGKTNYIQDVLRKNNFQIIQFNSCDTFNKDFIYNMSTECMNDVCILSSFTKKPKKKSHSD